MDNTNEKTVSKNLIKALELLENEAPLGRRDCGQLCGKACCAGDKDTGMWLFPGEENLLRGIDGFTVKETEANFGYPMLVCSGSCDRKTRPLACRIYPFVPVLEDGRVRVIRDVRSLRSCPLTSEGALPDRRFLKAVRIAARYLLRDEETAEYLRLMQAELEEIAELGSKIS